MKYLFPLVTMKLEEGLRVSLPFSSMYCATDGPASVQRFVHSNYVEHGKSCDYQSGNELDSVSVLIESTRRKINKPGKPSLSIPSHKFSIIASRGIESMIF
jgi:hypothetical protein